MRFWKSTCAVSKTSTAALAGIVPFFVLLATCALAEGCNLFQGLSSFDEKKATATPTPTPRAQSTDSDAGARARAGCVDVRGRPPEGAATAVPGDAK